MAWHLAGCYISYLVSDKLKATMDTKFRAFNFKVDLSKYEHYNLGNKSGQDRDIARTTKTIKDFLND